MFKKISILLIVLCLISCKSAKPVVMQPKIVRKATVSLPIKKPAKPSVVIEKKQEPKISQDVKEIVKEKTEQKEENVKIIAASSDASQVLEATTRVKVTSAMVNDYISKYKTIAKTDMAKYGIPASITLAQGILESGAGTGPLSMQANNHFGIKCHKEWTGPSIKYDDDAEQECFRKYSDPFESYNDHSVFLSNRPRYALLFKLKKNDYKAWAKGLKNAGYATDVNYPSKLIGLIERYQLFQYDNEVLGNDFNQVVQTVQENEPSFQKQQPNLSASNSVHIVEKGDTLFSISKKYNISISELKQKNGISDTAISLGQTLQIR